MSTKSFTIAFILCVLLSSMSFAQLAVSPPDTIHLQSIGDTLVVPLFLENKDAAPLDAFGLTLTYPHNLLSFLSTDSLGTLTEEWMVISSRENEPGTVMVGGFHTEPTTHSGVLVNLLFRSNVSGVFCDTLRLVEFFDDLADAPSTYALITPVELVFFEATVLEDRVQLTWQTASESNNLGFEIERKSSQTEFSNIGFVPGGGTTTTSQRYTFTDTDINPGEFFYRLKQIDTNGLVHFSETIRVTITPAQAFVLMPNFPNPFNPLTTIHYTVPKQSFIRIDVYNIQGQLVTTLVNQTVPAGKHSTRWSGTNSSGKAVSPGVYFCRMQSGNDEVWYIKMVLAE